MNSKYLILVAIVVTFFTFTYIAVNTDTLQNQEVNRDSISPWHNQPIPPDSPPPEEKPPATLDDAVKSITEKECKDHVYKLADDEWEGRMSGKEGNVLAAKYIKEEFERYGLQTMYHRFNIRRMNPGPNNERGDNFTQNIYGWIEGSDPEVKDEIVVVGAHMDHIGYGPRMSRTPNRREIHNGADDNASGTSALMEIAQATAMLKPKRTVVFQAYSAEEMGLIGSRYYCDNPTFPKSNPSIRKHVAMVNMDMVGYLGRGHYFTGFFDGKSSIDIDRHIKDLNNKYNFANSITSRRSGGSDHASFYNKRVPIAFLHTGSHRWYHTPDDVASKLNYNGMQKVARYGFELTWKIANDSSRPRFNYSGFKPLPYTHDHGHPEVPFFHSYHAEREIPEELRPPRLIMD